jgi:hypothetical protein
VDLDRLRLGEKIVGVSAILLFIFMFFDWFSASVSGGGTSVSEGADAWTALDNIPIVLVIAIVVALGMVAIKLFEVAWEPPVAASLVVGALSALSLVLILYRIIDTPGGGGSFGPISVDISPAFGIFLALIAAGGMTYGAYRTATEEGVIAAR